MLVCSCGGVDRFRSPSFSFSSSTLFHVSNSRCHCSYLFRGFYVGSSYTTTQTKGEHTRSRSGVPCQLKKIYQRTPMWSGRCQPVQCSAIPRIKKANARRDIIQEDQGQLERVRKRDRKRNIQMDEEGRTRTCAALLWLKAYWRVVLQRVLLRHLHRCFF